MRLDSALSRGSLYIGSFIHNSQVKSWNPLLELVAKFLGLHGSGHVPLPPEELFKKWIKILRTAQRYVRQIPDDQMNLRATHNRDRQLAVLSHHIFSIGEALLECAVNGAKDLDGLTTKSLENGMVTTGAAIARRGDEVIAHLEQWWNGLDDKSCRHSMDIVNYGVISPHQMLDRCTWHWHIIRVRLPRCWSVRA